jgi:GntR family negative regulator for fad regulon and positive regulator of fabA
MNHTLIKPAKFTEDQLLRSILENIYPIGSNLPNERLLAEEIGVTRPTLREALQRLSRDGWIVIQHGKATKVNDYWKFGGLGILKGMTQHLNLLPEKFTVHLLEFRSTVLPRVTKLAVQQHQEEVIHYLKRAEDLADTEESFAIYDWDLQSLLANLSENPIYTLIFNDFSSIYKLLAQLYFHPQKIRNLSKEYYQSLLDLILTKNEDKIESLVIETMNQSIEIWTDIQNQ